MFGCDEYKKSNEKLRHIFPLRVSVERLPENIPVLFAYYTHRRLYSRYNGISCIPEFRIYNHV